MQLVPRRRAARPGARQRPRPDAEIVSGGEVSSRPPNCARVLIRVSLHQLPKGWGRAGSPRIGKCAQSTHSLTRAERSDGNDNPSLASVVRLTLNVNCVGPAIGRSAGFAPRRILSTYL